MFSGKIAPVIIAEVLNKGIERVRVGKAVVFDFSPDAFERDMTEGYPGLVADQFTKLEEILVGPGIAVAPTGLLFKHCLDQPDQVLVSLHSLFK